MMKIAAKLLTISAACFVIGGLTMGAAPRVAYRPATAAKKTFNPFAVKAAASAKAIRAASAAAVSAAPPRAPASHSIRKHRPPVRPVYRPAVRSPFRPSPRR
jgi:hypothetical protein